MLWIVLAKLLPLEPLSEVQKELQTSTIVCLGMRLDAPWGRG